MAVRITVQADDMAECTSGFETVLKALAAAQVSAEPLLGPIRMSVMETCMGRIRLDLPGDAV